MFLLNVLFYSFIIVTCIQIIYSIVFFANFAFSKTSKRKNNTVGVSVIVYSKNQVNHIKKFLPSILNQDYNNFEVVLINDASLDNTLDIVEKIAEKNKKLKIVDVKNVEAFWANKKYALTLGIKAASYDYLLFTNANCKPVSNQWIKEMTACFTNKKTIVLGYGTYFKKKNNFTNKLIRFSTLITAMHYFSFAKLGMPFMGVGRNLSYHKNEFYKTNGFINHIDVRLGDDNLFVNEAANSKNTTISITKNSFTLSKPYKTLRQWYRQSRISALTIKRYKVIHKIILGLYYVTQLLFWVLSILLLVILFQWKIVLPLILFRLILQFLVVGFSAKKLNELDVLFLLPVLELFLIGFQLTIFTANLISKPNYWK